MTTADRPRTVYSVGELNEILRALIEDSLPSLWVQGEISNFSKPASGHWYFTLKDERAQIRCAMFRNANYYVRPVPSNGDAVLLRARAGVYAPRGELQLIVEHLEPAGTGALLQAFEALKARLAAEGLFAATAKRPLPAVPRRVGLITSSSGAAQHDVLTALQRRWPLAEVALYPVPVQGSEAPPAIIRALAELPRRAPVDLILLVRGGGSLEDLWAFNDEGVARAIRACAVPVVTGVGHETDTTIADFVADLRAATPTAAAELATPELAQWQARRAQLGNQLLQYTQRRCQQLRQQAEQLELRLRRQAPQRRLDERAQRLDELNLRLTQAGQRNLAAARVRLRHAEARLRAQTPQLHLHNARRTVDALQLRLHQLMQVRLSAQQQRLNQANAILQSLNPQAVLDRGYAIAQLENGTVLRDSATVSRGTAFKLRLASGELIGEVREISK